MIFIFSSRLNCRRFLVPAPSPALIAIPRCCNTNTAQSNNYATDQIRNRLTSLRSQAVRACAHLADSSYAVFLLPPPQDWPENSPPNRYCPLSLPSRNRPVIQKKISNTRFIPNLHTDCPFASFFSLKSASAPGTAEQPVRTWDHADVPCLFCAISHFIYYTVDPAATTKLGPDCFSAGRKTVKVVEEKEGRPTGGLKGDMEIVCRCLPRSYFVYSASVDTSKAEGRAGSAPGQRLKKSE